MNKVSAKQKSSRCTYSQNSPVLMQFPESASIILPLRCPKPSLKRPRFCSPAIMSCHAASPLGGSRGSDAAVPLRNTRSGESSSPLTFDQKQISCKAECSVCSSALRRQHLY